MTGSRSQVVGSLAFGVHLERICTVPTVGRSHGSAENQIPPARICPESNGLMQQPPLDILNGIFMDHLCVSRIIKIAIIRLAVYSFSASDMISINHERFANCPAKVGHESSSDGLARL